MHGRHRSVAAGTLFLLCAAPIAVAQAAASPIARDAAALDLSTDDGLDAFVALAVPAVERACGRAFCEPPVAVLADAGDIMRLVRTEVRREVETFYAGMPAGRIERALQLRADVAGASLLGKYSFVDGEVLVRPQSVRPNLTLLGLADADEQAVLQLVIVHELVHALQDQHTATGERVLGLRDANTLERLSALIEGHAVLCSERAAEALGITTAIPALRFVIAGSSSPPDQAGAPLQTRRSRGRGQLIYIDAVAWLEGEMRAGGTERLWQMLAADPTPQPPPARELPLEDRAARLAEVLPRLGGPTWTCGKGPLDEIELLCENLTARHELRELLQDTLRGGAMLMASAPSPVFWRLLHVAEFADDGAAQRFVEIAERSAHDDVAAFFRGDVEATEGPALEGDCDHSHTLAQPQPPGGIAGQVTWVRRGARVLQLTMVGALMDLDEQSDLFTHVLRTLETPDRER